MALLSVRSAVRPDICSGRSAISFCKVCCPEADGAQTSLAATFIYIYFPYVHTLQRFSPRNPYDWEPLVKVRVSTWLKWLRKKRYILPVKNTEPGLEGGCKKLN